MKWDRRLLEEIADVAGMNPDWLQQRVRDILRGLADFQEAKDA